jgi:hypothetical protein
VQGCFPGVSGLPKPVRTLFATIFFAEAFMLLYALVTRFPIEFHVYLATTILVYALAQQIQLKRERPENPATQTKLEQALEAFKEIVGLGWELKVVWTPQEGQLAGEVDGDTIYIYEQDYDKALEVLAHEFIEYIILQTQKPYIQLINALIRNINDKAYRRRDKVAEALSKLLLAHLKEKSSKHAYPPTHTLPY